MFSQRSVFLSTAVVRFSKSDNNNNKSIRKSVNIYGKIKINIKTEKTVTENNKKKKKTHSVDNNNSTDSEKI